MKETKLNFWFHEISWKIFYTFFSTVFCFCICFFYADVFLCEHLQIFLQIMPKNALKFTTFFVTETFSSMLTLSLYTTFLCIFPFMLYCLHTFCRPSYFFYEAYKQLIFLILSFSLSIVAHLFFKYSLLPNILQFFISLGNNELWQHIPNVYNYILFSLSLAIGFQILCQLTCLGIYIDSMSLSNYLMLARTRKYWHIGLLLFSAFICPPDVFLQSTCWVFLVLCFEFMHLGFCFVRSYKKQ